MKIIQIVVLHFNFNLLALRFILKPHKFSYKNKFVGKKEINAWLHWVDQMIVLSMAVSACHHHQEVACSLSCLLSAFLQYALAVAVQSIYHHHKLAVAGIACNAWIVAGLMEETGLAVVYEEFFYGILDW
jgi:hypothetical protein